MSSIPISSSNLYSVVSIVLSLYLIWAMLWVVVAGVAKIYGARHAFATAVGWTFWFAAIAIVFSEKDSVPIDLDVARGVPRPYVAAGWIAFLAAAYLTKRYVEERYDDADDE